MTIASRFYAAFAALALVLAGIAAVPSPARAATTGAKAAIAGAVVIAVIVTAVVLLDGEDEEEGPQSP